MMAKMLLILLTQIILNSMHKYIPCMKIMCQSDGCSQSYSFPETTFIAVTAYQSTGVSKYYSLYSTKKSTGNFLEILFGNKAKFKGIS